MLTIKIPSGVKSIGWLKSLSLGFNNFIFKTEKGGGGVLEIQTVVILLSPS